MVSIFSLLNHFEHVKIGLKLSGAKKRYGESRLEYGNGNVNLYIRQRANFDSACRILEFGCRILEVGNFQNSTPNSQIPHPNSRMSKLARCRIYRFTFPI